MATSDAQGVIELLAGVATGVIANAITPLLSTGRRLLAESIPEGTRRRLGTGRDGDEALHARIRTHIQQCAEVRRLRPVRGREAVVEELQSPATEVLLRGLFSDAVHRQARPMPVDVTRAFEAFRAKALGRLPKDSVDPALDNFAQETFDMLLDTMNKYLGDLVETGVLAAHDTKDAFRHNVILSEIQN